MLCMAINTLAQSTDLDFGGDCDDNGDECDDNCDDCDDNGDDCDDNGDDDNNQTGRAS